MIDSKIESPTPSLIIHCYCCSLCFGSTRYRDCGSSVLDSPRTRCWNKISPVASGCDAFASTISSNCCFLYNTCPNTYAFPDNGGTNSYTPAYNVVYTCGNTEITINSAPAQPLASPGRCGALESRLNVHAHAPD
ncbi:hypothetical protein CY34DRAFT_814390 [Suillus luteus UH-Slu-Lm8-n1]|uniref:Uncharacterized protein n=1 Tax=Suillus luteus UH-Slu-Lm8-n1 TaxID=930992 RepID=A0A0D0A217_9AGAM|nr:hypothetical protein CY34DRAFT_814390 [Suillus luteus UH-Slu-Lm8-n1]